MSAAKRDQAPRRDQVTRALRKRLLRGEFPPGTRLSALGIAAEYQVRPSEALQVLYDLIAQGYVTEDVITVPLPAFFVRSTAGS